MFTKEEFVERVRSGQFIEDGFDSQTLYLVKERLGEKLCQELIHPHMRLQRFLGGRYLIEWTEAAFMRVIDISLHHCGGCGTSSVLRHYVKEICFWLYILEGKVHTKPDDINSPETAQELLEYVFKTYPEMKR